MSKITDPAYPAITSAQSDDLLMVVDVHNATESPQGTTSRISVGNLPHPVASVFGRVGAVTQQSGDYTAGQVGAVPATTVGEPNGVASLDSGGYVPSGELPSPTTSSKGAIQLGGGTSNFLRADGTWAIPPGGGGGGGGNVGNLDGGSAPGGQLPAGVYDGGNA
jgi:hypothetical protein